MSKHQRMFHVAFLWCPAFSSIPSTVGTQTGSAHTSVSRTGACLYLLPQSRQSHLALISAFWRKCLFSAFLLSIPMLPMVLELIPMVGKIFSVLRNFLHLFSILHFFTPTPSGVAKNWEKVAVRTSPRPCRSSQP